MSKSKLRIVLVLIGLIAIGFLIAGFYSAPPELRMGFLLPFQMIFRILTANPITLGLTILLILAVIFGSLYRKAK